MLEGIIKERNKDQIECKAGSISYGLCEYSDMGESVFIFSVKFEGRTGRCVLDCSTYKDALRLYATLIRCKTTPLSLNETAYELFR